MCQNNNKMKNEMKQEAIEAIIETLENGYHSHYCDLHHYVFNTDYYIIGSYAAKQALREYDVFDAIDLVTNYEKENFGMVLTNLGDPEKLINMVFYVIGDEVIAEMSEISAFADNWNDLADERTNAMIVRELKEMYDF